ncbi:MAG: MoaD/ThiS family protein [Fimbriimonas sp.]
MSVKRAIHIRYFASMREHRGLGSETVLTTAASPAALYGELAEAHNFRLPQSLIRFALNGEFAEASALLNHGDELCLIPPVAGG